MYTHDAIDTTAPIERAYDAAVDVARWPDILPHYRWVRWIEQRGRGTGIVEMAANRPFGPLNWPTWWRSEMRIDPERWAVQYRHIGGITTGMDVVWQLEPLAAGTRLTIIHQWRGPSWPLIRRPAAEWVIGPVFVHGIASRTLAGIKRSLERT